MYSQGGLHFAVIPLCFIVVQLSVIDEECLTLISIWVSKSMAVVVMYSCGHVFMHININKLLNMLRKLY